MYTVHTIMQNTLYIIINRYLIANVSLHYQPFQFIVDVSYSDLIGIIQFIVLVYPSLPRASCAHWSSERRNASRQHPEWLVDELDI